MLPSPAIASRAVDSWRALGFYTFSLSGVRRRPFWRPLALRSSSPSLPSYDDGSGSGVDGIRPSPAANRSSRTVPCLGVAAAPLSPRRWLGWWSMGRVDDDDGRPVTLGRGLASKAMVVGGSAGDDMGSSKLMGGGSMPRNPRGGSRPWAMRWTLPIPLAGCTGSRRMRRRLLKGFISQSGAPDGAAAARRRENLGSDC